jgi:hypothetical protein
LEHGLVPVIAPDFAKSVVVEGCGGDWADGEDWLALRPDRPDHGELAAGQAMHLVGGASLPALAAYFARTVVQSPDTVLPLGLYCLGRHYRACPPGPWDLASAQQSSACQMLVACASKEQADSQLERLLAAVQAALAFLPNYRIEERGLQGCARSEARRLAVTVQGKQELEVGHLAVQGDYLAR